ncbi:MAG TPA: hypothetical protein VNG51_27555 [Ktedonobacteraceae bacterium]|nr:hypothetical protein [Ktedonobacteraceae bacterium]
MKDAIIEKLDRFLGGLDLFTEEYEAVYLMVELRKLLDREVERMPKKKKFPLVRFYCNWTVHTSKAQNNGLVTQVKSIIDEILKTQSADFLMPAFRIELSNLLAAFGLPEKLCSDATWNQFVNVFVQVLADQPIDKLEGSVSSFCYKPVYKDRIVVEITFNDHRGIQRFESAALF